MSRASIGLVLACLGGAGLLPQTGEAHRIALRPPTIVWIEAGEFVMGADRHDVAFAVDLCREMRPVEIPSIDPSDDGACARDRFEREGPARRVWTGAFGIDRTEVTHRAWRACVIEGRCPPSRIRPEDGRLTAGDLPVAGVTWEEARGYCEFAGGRLPTEAEWERAARGTARHRFPWGRQYNSRLANHGRSPRGPSNVDGWQLAAPVGSFPDGASPHGLLDAAGNVWEWTAAIPAPFERGIEHTGFRVIRGGSWAQPPEAMRVTHRGMVRTGDHRPDLGVRCAYDRRTLAGSSTSAILRALGGSTSS